MKSSKVTYERGVSTLLATTKAYSPLASRCSVLAHTEPSSEAETMTLRLNLRRRPVGVGVWTLKQQHQNNTMDIQSKYVDGDSHYFWLNTCICLRFSYYHFDLTHGPCL